MSTKKSWVVRQRRLGVATIAIAAVTMLVHDASADRRAAARSNLAGARSNAAAGRGNLGASRPNVSRPSAPQAPRAPQTPRAPSVPRAPVGSRPNNQRPNVSRPSPSRPNTSAPSLGGRPATGRPTTGQNRQLPGSVGTRPDLGNREINRPAQGGITTGRGGTSPGAGITRPGQTRPGQTRPGLTENRPSGRPDLGNLAGGRPGGGLGLPDRVGTGGATLPDRGNSMRPDRDGLRPSRPSADQVNDFLGIQRPGRERPAIDRPNLGRDRPGLDRDRTGLDRDRPGLDRDRPGLDRDRPGLDRDRPGLDRDRPGLDRDRPGLDRDRPGLDRDRPGLDRDRPNLNLPGLDGDRPIFDRPGANRPDWNNRPDRPIIIGGDRNLNIHDRPSWVTIDRDRLGEVRNRWGGVISNRPEDLHRWPQRYPQRVARWRSWGNSVRFRWTISVSGVFGPVWWATHRPVFCLWHHWHHWNRHSWSFWWGRPTFPGLTSWFVWSAPAVVWQQPIFYDFGPGGNVVFEDNRVFIAGVDVGSVEEFAQSAADLATVPPPEDEAELDATEWMPLGTFAVSTSELEGEPTRFVQLAVSQEGVVSGTYFNSQTEHSQTLLGRVDPETQRVALRLAEDEDLVIETGIYNLTLDEAPVLVHFGSESSEFFLLIRMEMPEEDWDETWDETAPVE